MKNTILTIALGIFLLSLTSATTMIAGECNNITFPNSDEVEVVYIGNSTDMNGFSYEKNGTIIEYCISLDFKPDNFTVIWRNGEYEVSTSSSSGRAAGGSVWSYKNVEVNETIEDVEEVIDDVEDTEVVEEEEIIIPEEAESNAVIIAFISLMVIGGIGLVWWALK